MGRKAVVKRARVNGRKVATRWLGVLDAQTSTKN